MIDPKALEREMQKLARAAQLPPAPVVHSSTPPRPALPMSLPNSADGKEVVAHKLYVGNLDMRVKEFHLVKLFQPMGKIVRLQFLWHRFGQKRNEPKGYCFIEFSTREEAARAKALLNGKPLLGRPLSIRFSEEKIQPNYSIHRPHILNQVPTGLEDREERQSEESTSAAIKIMAIQNK
eukprot:CAMPEP_0177669994 /NCGR_PEP_ID=MMETSP0447-20121125/23820_1 /TAXON_ID=0 /ORGANISM="Stygamoeba regulata, Strain BSH-02190019" /LENGTH=178 /DNA_ID=CAMNT_0019177063 /DNA_START=73 /DNA_END=606 /DNA_ORIENTATION=+